MEFCWNQALVMKNKTMRLFLWFFLLLGLMIPVSAQNGLAEILQTQPAMGSLLEQMSDEMKQDAFLNYLDEQPKQGGSIGSAEKKSDSLTALFIHADTALGRPGEIPANQMATEAQKQPSLRYAVRLFQTVPPSLFSNTTNRVSGDYPLKAGDELILTIWGEVEKEHRVRIDNRGQVQISGIGEVSLTSLTLKEAEAAVRQRLKRVYSGFNRNKTHMSLRLISLSPVKVYVMGEVANPGAYVFYGNTSIFQAIHQAGGPTESGSVRKIRVVRDSGDSSVVDLYSYIFAGQKTTPDILLDGDVVFLPPADGLVGISGEIHREGVFELADSSTLAELIQIAGGVQPTIARFQPLVVNRVLENGSRSFFDLPAVGSLQDSSQKVLLQNGDLIHFPRSRESSKNSVFLQGSVKYPGNYKLDSGSTISAIIQRAGGLLPEAYDGRVQIIRPLDDGQVDLIPASIEDSDSAPDILAGDTLRVYSRKEMNVPDSVSISGAVAKPGLYRFYPGMSAKDLVLLAGGYLSSRKVGLLRLDRRVGGRETEVKKHSVGENYQLDGEIVLLQPWDHLEVPFDPEFERPRKVVLSGAFRWPGTYVLQNPREKIEDLISRAGGLKEEAYTGGARFFRLFETDSLEQIGLNLPRALEKDKYYNISLQHGDSIFVPTRWASVRVSGAVGYPSNVLYKEGKGIWYYIDRAGGLIRESDEDRIRVRYANGSVSTISSMDGDPDPGAEIIIPAKPVPPPTDWVRVARAVATVLGAVSTSILAVVAIMEISKN